MTEYLMNRLGNCKNPNQGVAKKILCVCSAGLLRSPTAAVVLARAPYNFNTRAAGMIKQFALIPVDQVLLTWCDEVVCMEEEHVELLGKLMNDTGVARPVKCLDIQDAYEYMDDKLVWLIEQKYVP